MAAAAAPSMRNVNFRIKLQNLSALYSRRDSGNLSSSDFPKLTRRRRRSGTSASCGVRCGGLPCLRTAHRLWGGGGPQTPPTSPGRHPGFQRPAEARRGTGAAVEIARAADLRAAASAGCVPIGGKRRSCREPASNRINLRQFHRAFRRSGRRARQSRLERGCMAVFVHVFDFHALTLRRISSG